MTEKREVNRRWQVGGSDGVVFIFKYLCFLPLKYTDILILPSLCSFPKSFDKSLLGKRHGIATRTVHLWSQNDVQRYMNVDLNIIWIRISKDFPETSSKFKQKIATSVLLRLFISDNGHYDVNNYLYKNVKIK